MKTRGGRRFGRDDGKFHQTFYSLVFLIPSFTFSSPSPVATVVDEKLALRIEKLRT